MSDKIDRVVMAAVKLVANNASYQASQQDLHDLTDAVKDANLLPGEVIFCLRSKDRAMPKTVGAWCIFAEREGSPPDTINQARSKQAAAEAWQQDPDNQKCVQVPT